MEKKLRFYEWGGSAGGEGGGRKNKRENKKKKLGNENTKHKETTKPQSKGG